MPAPWEPSFDVYLTQVEGDIPLAVVLDMAVAQHGPLPSHPLRLMVRVPLQHPRPDGLRDASEQEAMGAVEDSLVETLTAKLDAIFVGRFMAEGVVTFGFYLPEASRTRAEHLDRELPPLGGYSAEGALADDPDWEFYFDFLFPDRFSHQVMMNRQVLANLVEAGDHLQSPREIDFFAYFPSRPQADEAMVTLDKAGYRSDAPEASDERPAAQRWSLQFHRHDRLADGRADELCHEILTLLAPHEGVFDGWGSPLAKA